VYGEREVDQGDGKEDQHYTDYIHVRYQSGFPSSASQNSVGLVNPSNPTKSEMLSTESGSGDTRNLSADSQPSFQSLENGSFPSRSGGPPAAHRPLPPPKATAPPHASEVSLDRSSGDGYITAAGAKTNAPTAEQSISQMHLV